MNFKGPLLILNFFISCTTNDSLIKETNEFIADYEVEIRHVYIFRETKFNDECLFMPNHANKQLSLITGTNITSIIHY